VLCNKCRGTGAKDPSDIQRCTECNGQGIKITTRQLGPGFVQQMQTTYDRALAAAAAAINASAIQASSR